MTCASPHSCWLLNKGLTVTQRSKHSPLRRWVTQPTGLWTMSSPLLLLLGSPGATLHYSPQQGTKNREQPCALWASSCCCCSFLWFAVSVSCSIPTAACHHRHGQTTRRGRTKGSLIMQLCKFDVDLWYFLLRVSIENERTCCVKAYYLTAWHESKQSDILIWKLIIWKHWHIRRFVPFFLFSVEVSYSVCRCFQCKDSL